MRHRETFLFPQWEYLAFLAFLLLGKFFEQNDRMSNGRVVGTDTFRSLGFYAYTVRRNGQKLRDIGSTLTVLPRLEGSRAPRDGLK